jgi:AcrR family transcriptional regulator
VTPNSVGATAKRGRQRRPDARLQRDAEEKELLLDSARYLLHESGITGMKIRDVLAHADLGTRAFYRHFASKDDLVLTMFKTAASQEAERLRQRMAPATDPLAAVIAWIDGRLDLAFDRKVSANLHDLTTEAQLRRPESPAELQIALDLMLEPLVEQLHLGQKSGIFTNVDPNTDARFIHDITNGVVESHWSGFPQRKRDARNGVLRFCVAAIGAGGATELAEEISCPH